MVQSFQGLIDNSDHHTYSCSTKSIFVCRFGVCVELVVMYLVLLSVSVG